jgi:hypothetical protein
MIPVRYSSNAADIRTRLLERAAIKLASITQNVLINIQLIPRNTTGLPASASCCLHSGAYSLRKMLRCKLPSYVGNILQCYVGLCCM